MDNGSFRGSVQGRRGDGRFYEPLELGGISLSLSLSIGSSRVKIRSLRYEDPIFLILSATLPANKTRRDEMKSCYSLSASKRFVEFHSVSTAADTQGEGLLQGGGKRIGLSHRRPARLSARIRLGVVTPRWSVAIRGGEEGWKKSSRCNIAAVHPDRRDARVLTKATPRSCLLLPPPRVPLPPLPGSLSVALRV